LADIFVLPSLLEGFGFPIVESMACGTPVIATNVGAIPEIIGTSGIVVSPQRPDQLANRIDTLLGDQQMRTDLINSGMNRVRNHFTLNRMVERTNDFYMTSLSRKRFR
jgi:glycosyltransferase involved in cell wall biosynthesis